MLPQKPTELSDAWLDSIFAVATYLPSAIAVRRRRQTSTPTLRPQIRHLSSQGIFLGKG